MLAQCTTFTSSLMVRYSCTAVEYFPLPLPHLFSSTTAPFIFALALDHHILALRLNISFYH
jgi:hypothetical protein